MSKKTVLNKLKSFIFPGILLIAMLNPSVKALMIRGLMSIGFFQPDTDKQQLEEIKAGSYSVLFKNIQGEVINLQELQGKVVFINFWATWCPPCRAEMPMIDKLYKQFQHNPDVIFLMVSVDDNCENVQEFITSKNYSLPIYTPASTIPEEMLGQSIPTTLLLNKKGQIVFKHEGAADFSNQEIIDLINRLSK